MESKLWLLGTRAPGLVFPTVCTQQCSLETWGVRGFTYFTGHPSSGLLPPAFLAPSTILGN